jgi:hypothetical protein
VRLVRVIRSAYMQVSDMYVSAETIDRTNCGELGHQTTGECPNCGQGMDAVRMIPAETKVDAQKIVDGFMEYHKHEG